MTLRQIEGLRRILASLGTDLAPALAAEPDPVRRREILDFELHKRWARFERLYVKGPSTNLHRFRALRRRRWALRDRTRWRITDQISS